jgi:hypothetical protein
MHGDLKHEVLVANCKDRKHLGDPHWREILKWALQAFISTMINIRVWYTQETSQHAKQVSAF